MQPETKQTYLISITSRDRTERIAMRNALWRLHASEVLPGLFMVALTPSERRALARRFGGVRMKEG